MAERVSSTIRDGVADVRLTRGAKLNALDGPMFDALIETGEALAADPSVRAVVLSGEGRAFCAGLDLAAFGAGIGKGAAGTVSGVDAALARVAGGIASVVQHAVNVWTELPAPVIAAVHGYAFGGGLQLALGADLRIVAPDAQLSVLEIKLGLVPDMTGTAMLPRLVGLDVAKELTFTGRVVTGVEALRLGLATRLSDHPRDDALGLAAEIAGNSPTAIRAAKALLNRAGPGGSDESLEAEQEAQRRLVDSADQREAVLAYLERRPPRFPT